MSSAVESHGASFRDPSGFIFRRGGVVLRQVNQAFEHHYRKFLDSGLCGELIEAGLMLPFEESTEEPSAPGALCVLRPQALRLISYPWEWSFGQRKDAALVTLDIAKRARQKGMVLKDANAFNIQFYQGRPVLIDHLSFEAAVEGEPWVAYHQFCEQFLAPLALMALVDIRLGGMMRGYTAGVPLDLASTLLPGSSKMKLGLLAHIHGHAKARKQSEGGGSGSSARMNDTAHLALLDNLTTTIKSLQWTPEGTVWGDYYAQTNYSPDAMDSKRRLVKNFLTDIDEPLRTCWDLGANTGEFSQIAAELGLQTTAWDIDPAAVEKNYRAVKEKGLTNLLPLRQDFADPSPRLGWDLNERESLADRGPADAALALALVHHLAIANNVPLSLVAKWLSKMGRWVIVEFVPKSDSQTQRLLASRRDIFDGYHEEGFAAAMDGHFELVRREMIPDSERTLFLYRARE